MHGDFLDDPTRVGYYRQRVKPTPTADEAKALCEADAARKTQRLC
jgi:hypothetical protein